MPGRPAPLADRFWAKVDRTGGAAACWPWTGCVGNRHGGSGGKYGQLRTGGRGAPLIKAHRLALIYTRGEAPPDRPEACHAPACTTTLCCNGDHLRWGTRLENMADVRLRRDLRTQHELLVDTLDALEREGVI